MAPKLTKLPQPHKSVSLQTPPQKRRLSDLVVQPKKQSRAQSSNADQKASTAPIEMCVWKYSDDAQEYIKNAPSNVPLWCIRIDHEAWPKMTSGLMEGLNAYLRSLGDTEGQPTNIKELQECGIRVNITRFESGGRDIPNPDNAPLEQ